MGSLPQVVGNLLDGGNSNSMAIPKYDELFNPLIVGLTRLGGSGTNAEIVDEVARVLGLSDAEVDEQTSRGQSRFAYRLAWARSYLKAYGLLTNSERGIWALTDAGRQVDEVDAADVRRVARANYQASKGQLEADTEDGLGDEVSTDGWREELLTILTNLDPAQFERLCQRILRESGFVQVEVTGRAGDGGIDGTGVVELGGLLTFPILFQCKRYQGSVGPNIVRDFRGAMIGRADRGLILTTGLFSKEARREAQRDGAPPVDLVDRERLMDKLKDLRLGVAVEMVESVSVVSDWFRNL